MKQGPNGGPVAYISSLSSAKADPKIPAIVNQPMTVNGNAAGTAGIEPAQPKPPPPAPQPAPPGTFLLRIKELKSMRQNILDQFEKKLIFMITDMQMETCFFRLSSIFLKHDLIPSS